MIFKSTALRFTALNGKMRFWDEGRTTPFPISSIEGITGEKSIFVLNAEARGVPLKFFNELSILSSALPSGLETGKMLTIFELILLDISFAPDSQIRPSVSWAGSTGSEKKMSI